MFCLRWVENELLLTCGVEQECGRVIVLAICAFHPASQKYKPILQEKQIEVQFKLRLCIISTPLRMCVMYF